MMLVRDLMTRDVQACGPGSTLAEAALMMWRRDCGFLPVVNAGREIIGVITDRDLCMAIGTERRDTRSVHDEDVMTRNAVTCRPDDIHHVSTSTMALTHVRRLPVTNESGKLVGVLSLDDLAVAAQESSRPEYGPSRAEVMEVLRAAALPRWLRGAVCVVDYPLP
jgi:CBS domain-containing protein